jgi:hypothetical protein
VPCPAASERPAVHALIDEKSASRADRSIEVVALLCVDPPVVTGWPLTYTCTTEAVVAVVVEEEGVDADAV